MAKQTNVELLIKAKDEAGKVLSALSQTVQELTGSNLELSKASGNTETALVEIGKAASLLADKLAEAQSGLAKAQQTLSDLKAQRETAQAIEKQALAYEKSTEAARKQREELEKLRETNRRLVADFVAKDAKGQNTDAAGGRLQKNTAAIRQAESEIVRLERQAADAQAEVLALDKSFDVAKSGSAAAKQELDRLTASIEQQTRAVSELRSANRGVESAQRDAQKAAAYLADQQARDLREVNAYLEQLDRESQARRKAQYAKFLAEAAALERAAAAKTASIAQQRSEQNAASAISSRQDAEIVRAKELQRLREDIQQRSAETAAREAALSRNLDKELRQQADSVRKLAAEKERAAAATRKLVDGERTTLSLYQRIRGEVLALASAYVGLYGALDQVNKAIEEQRKNVSGAARLQTVFGDDPKKIADEFALVRVNADELGQSVSDSLDVYTKFSAGLVASGASAEQARQIYLNLSRAAAGLGTTQEDLNGILKAVEQSFSKGTVQAEELRGQIGDRLPGATALLAKALKVPAQEIPKLLEEGRISAEALVGFAEEARKQYGNIIPDTAARQIAQFQNAVAELRKEFFAEFEPQFVEVLRELKESLASNETREAVRNLANVLGFLLKAIVAALPYLDTFVTLIGASVLGRALGSAVSGFQAFVVAVKAGGGAIATLAATGPAILGWVGIVTAAAYEFGDALQENFEVVRKGAVELIAFLDKMSIRVAGFFDKAAARRNEAQNRVLEQAAKDLQRQESTARALSKSKGDALDQEANKLAKERAGIESRIAESKKSQASVAQVELETQEKLRRAEETRRETLQAVSDAERKKQRAAQKAELDAARAQAQKLADATLSAAAPENVIKPKGDKDKDAEKAAKKREQEVLAQARLVEQVENQLSGFRETVYKKERTSLEDQLSAIDEQFRETFNKIDQVKDRAVADNLRQQLDELVNARKGQVTEEFELARAKDAVTYAQEQATDAETRYQEVLTERATLQAEIDRQVEEGLITEFEGKQQTIALINETNPKLREELELRRELLVVLAEQQRALGTAEGNKAAAETEQRIAEVDRQMAGIRDKTQQALVSVREVKETVAGGLTEGILAFGEGIGKVLTGVGSMKDAFKSAGNVIRQFFADFLRRIAQAILQQTILNALSSFGGAWGQVAAGAAGGGTQTWQFHTGGIVGSGGQARNVPAMAFATAQRYHTGGMAGLRPDEVPAILQRGEEVLTANDPRHRNNGGGGAVKSDVKIVNMIDSGSVVSEGMNTPGGQQAIINVIRANAASIKQVLA